MSGFDLLHPAVQYHIVNSLGWKSLRPFQDEVIVDEIHAFAGDDRGWHLLSVLSRITKFAGQELQRIGLSATVGNCRQPAATLRMAGRILHRYPSRVCAAGSGDVIRTS